MNISVIVGKFNYFHKEYESLIKKALSISDIVLVYVEEEALFSQDIRKMQIESTYLKENRLHVIPLKKATREGVESQITTIIKNFGGTLKYFVTADENDKYFENNKSIEKVVVLKTNRIRNHIIEAHLKKYDIKKLKKYFNKNVYLFLDVLADELIARDLGRTEDEKNRKILTGKEFNKEEKEVLYS